MWWKTVERHMKQREEAVLKVARKSIGGSFIFHQSTNLFILYWFYIICQWLFNLTQQFCIEEGLWETNYFPFVGRVLNHDSEVMTKQNKWHWIQNHVVIHLLLNDNSMHAKKKRDRLSPAQTGILIQFLRLSKSFFLPQGTTYWRDFTLTLWTLKAESKYCTRSQREMLFLFY